MSKRLIRVFMHNNKELVDINPNLSPEAVAKHYSNEIPELANATVTGPTIKDGRAIYDLTTKVGTKG